LKVRFLPLIILILLTVPFFSLILVNAQVPWDSGSILVRSGVSFVIRLSIYTDIKYTVLHDFYCDRIVPSSSDIVFWFGGNQWSINDLVPYGLFSFIMEYNPPNSTPIVNSTMGDLFVKTLYLNNVNSGLLEKQSYSYSGAHDFPVANISVLNPSWLFIGQLNQSGFYSVLRDYLFFDTSAIFRGAEIINATLCLYESSGTSYFGTYNLIVQNGQPNYPSNPIQLTDYNKNFYSGNYGNLSTDDMIFGDYNYIPLDKSIITLGSLTKLCLRSENDVNGVNDESDGLLFQNMANSTAMLKIVYSTDAELIISAGGIPLGSFPAVYIDGVQIGILSSLNAYSITYLIQPNNITTNPYYTISFGSIDGYITPNSIQVSLGYGNIKGITAIYYIYVPLPNLVFPSYINQLLYLLMIGGVMAFVCYLITSRFDHGMAGAIGGFMIGFFMCAYTYLIPVWWFIIGVTIFSMLVYLWWKGRD